MTGRRIAFQAIASAAVSRADAIVSRWLPDGRREGSEWVARNPRRSDKRLGSFKVNLKTGRWGDFAAGETGGDLISLAAFVHGIDQAEAACRLADMIGMDPYDD